MAVTWKNTYLAIRKDLLGYGGRSLKTKLTIYFFSSPFRLLLNYRLGRYLSHHNNSLYKLLSKRYKYRQLTKRNCDISYNADIGENVRFLHPLGVVIGDRVVINNNVRIWQHVTIGSHGKNDEDSKYPIIESDVKIFAGAIIAGGITIGKGAVIGAGSVVLNDVPLDTVAVGSPAKIIKK